MTHMMQYRSLTNWVPSLAAGMALLALAACAVGPNYHRPDAPTAPAYKEDQGWTPAVPAQVTNVHKTTLVFDWSVPLKVGTQAVSINGTLYWIGENDSFPAWALISLIIVVVLGMGIGITAQRRRIARDEADETW